MDLCVQNDLHYSGRSRIFDFFPHLISIRRVLCVFFLSVFRFFVSRSSGDTPGWDSLAGYADVKQEIEDTLILPLRHPVSVLGCTDHVKLSPLVIFTARA